MPPLPLLPAAGAAACVWMCGGALCPSRLSDAVPVADLKTDWLAADLSAADALRFRVSLPLPWGLAASCAAAAAASQPEYLSGLLDAADGSPFTFRAAAAALVCSATEASGPAVGLGTAGGPTAGGAADAALT